MKYFKIKDTIEDLRAWFQSIGVDGLGYATTVKKSYLHDYIPQHDYSLDYLTIESLEDDNVITWGEDIDLYTSVDNGNTWECSFDVSSTTLNSGECVLLKSERGYRSPDTITTTKTFDVKGNYMSLFYGDNFAGQTVIPELVTIPTSDIFGFTKVVNAKDLILPATTLTEHCYGSLFTCCTNLITAPELPATTLSDYCYYYMFQGCTSLTIAPNLPATALTNECYSHMFSGCTSLNYIKCLASDISANNCAQDWVSGTASSGTFVKDANTTWPTGVNGIPDGWTVQDA